MVGHMLRTSRKKQALLCIGVLIVALCAAGGCIFVYKQMGEGTCEEGASKTSDEKKQAPLGADAKKDQNSKAPLKEPEAGSDAKNKQGAAQAEAGQDQAKAPLKEPEAGSDAKNKQDAAQAEAGQDQEKAPLKEPEAGSDAKNKQGAAQAEAGQDQEKAPAH
ncbi:uncharacterized protein NEMAJ01_1172 [Nematocida major]|uniref:uncharacterized protein n=1 Tax=Nematocida major TaxID=1912982 RepID=UPI0020086DCD|nr:uncharacterized protein NEMAJ01_1172 [Nematocida major]KAH9386276.1 hypothetical protein NEMAJ01_1172 [Nematocida major]